MSDPAPISLDIPGVTVRRATVDDLDRVRAVVQDGTRRVQEKGFPECTLYLTEKGEARVGGEGGAETFIATRASDGRDVGVYTLTWDDVRHWGETLGNDGRAGYIHMLSVHRAAARSGMGERLLRHAESLIASKPRPLFRLDCWDGNPFLHAYCARKGFTLVGRNADRELSLWEKRVVG